MRIEIEKASGKSICRGWPCKALPKYISNGRIIAGTICAAVSISSASGGGTAYYCRDCIDQIYAEFKTKLNAKLWPLQ